MAESERPGGAYLSSDGVTWHDADGKKIAAPLLVPVQPEAIANDATVATAAPTAAPAPVAPAAEPKGKKTSPKPAES